ncbi:MAG TPA: pitrilysin family protein [Sphingobacteriaceae bacterium]
MIDRTIPPAYRQVDQINFIPAKEHTLDNGIGLHVVDAGEQELVRIEFIFNNVAWNESRPLQAFAVSSMLTDGTSGMTGAEISEKIDYYGAFLQADYNYDNSTVALYSLNKHLANTLPIVKSIMTDSIFPQEELDTFIRNHKQSLSVNLEKNDFVGRRAFNNALFGNTLYGYSIQASDYDQVTRQQLLDYFKTAYKFSNCHIMVSGKVTDETMNIINELFGKDPVEPNPATPNQFTFSNTEGKEYYIERPEALQSAIRIGKVSINRTHEDFAGLQVVNTILGGYFGSRLMANIREDKGYTYGIGSALVSLRNAGYFFIATEVGVDVCASALAEIEKEISILKTELVAEEELALVRNYMLGSLLGGLENAFSHADKFKNIYPYGLGYDYYERYIQKVETITPQEILELANKYLDINSFHRVIVGKK